MEITTREAAVRLHVTQDRVGVLARTGILDARRVGAMWLIDAESVDRQAAIVSAGATGRPMSTRSAWALGELADGGDAAWLHRAERARLRDRADLIDAGVAAEMLQKLLRSRCVDSARYRIGDRDIDDLLGADGVVATGVSAAGHYGLGLGTGGTADAYVTRDVADRLIRDYYLIASRTGNLTLRLVDEDWHLRSAQQIHDRLVAARLVAGVDLVDDTDTRTKSAGRTLIRSVLDDHQWRAAP